LVAATIGSLIARCGTVSRGNLINSALVLILVCAIRAYIVLINGVAAAIITNNAYIGIAGT
jgi:hypothetical protein